MSTKSLETFNKLDRKKYLIAFDSDGCIFDTMEVKHKECFTPVTIWKWDLQAVSRYARECHEFVNLYSKWRGINRFPALLRTLELLAQRSSARARGYNLPDLTALKTWMASEKAHSNATLKKAVEKNADPLLRRLLDWSEAVNKRVEESVYGVPPFPGVRDLLERAERECDMLVVSQTPTDALNREWKEHNIEKFVGCICGQEMGSKDEHLTKAGCDKYESHRTLVVGDAPGDYKAAKLKNALFYPILPGREDESWQRFLNEAYPRFIKGTYAGEYAAELLAEFDRILPEKPPFAVSES